MVISGPRIICNGDSAVLYVSDLFDHYQWSTGDIDTQSITVYPVIDSQYYVIGWNEATPDERVRSPIHYITVNTGITPEIEYLPSAQEGALWVPSVGAIYTDATSVRIRTTNVFDSYQWYVVDSDGQNPVPINGATQREYLVIRGGYYAVETYSYDCGAFSEPNLLSVSEIDDCFLNLIQPAAGTKNVQVDLPIIFDVRFNYSPYPPPNYLDVACGTSKNTINFCLYDGNMKVPLFQSNVAIHPEEDTSFGTDSGYRYVISGIRLRSGSDIRVTVTITGDPQIGGECP